MFEGEMAKYIVGKLLLECCEKLGRDAGSSRVLSYHYGADLQIETFAPVTRSPLSI